MGYVHFGKQLLRTRFYFGGSSFFVEIAAHQNVFHKAQIANQVHLLKNKSEIGISELCESIFLNGNQVFSVIGNFARCRSVHTA